MPEWLDVEAVRLAEWLWQSETHCDCLLDLRRVRFIDSTGVGLLLRLRKELRSAGKRLVLLSPSAVVCRTLQCMRVLNHFVTASDTEEVDGLLADENLRVQRIAKRPIRSALVGEPELNHVLG